VLFFQTKNKYNLLVYCWICAVNKITFTLYIEQIESGHYWGCIAEIPHLSRVVGENLLEVIRQVMAQLTYLIQEMSANWQVIVKTEIVLISSSGRFLP
jgi:hypothetical protein